MPASGEDRAVRTKLFTLVVACAGVAAIVWLAQGRASKAPKAVDGGSISESARALAGVDAPVESEPRESSTREELAPAPASSAVSSTRRCVGRVVLADGEPVAGVRLELEAQLDPAHPAVWVGSALTKDDGRFLVDLSEEWSPDMPVWVVMLEPAGLGQDPRPFRVDANDPIEVVLPGCRVTVHVFQPDGRPAQLANVRARSLDAGVRLAKSLSDLGGRTDVKGRARLDFVEPLQVELWAESWDGSLRSAPLEYAVRTGGRSNAVELELAPKPLRGAIEVFVTDDRGAPVEEFRAEAMRVDDPKSRRVGIADGTRASLFLEDLAPGRYTVRPYVWPSDPPPLYVFGEAQEVEVESATHIAPARFEAKLCAGVTVKLQRLDGFAPLRVAVRLDEEGAPWRELQGWTRTLASETGAVGARTWVMDVLTVSGDYSCAPLTPGWYEVRFVSESSREVLATRGPVRLEAGRFESLAVDL
jgi:hypothetical protein